MSNPNFSAVYSTNNIWRDTDMERCLTDDLDAMDVDIAALESGKANFNHTHDGYAPSDHTHTGYASASDVSQLQTLVGDTSVSSQIATAVSDKADTNHTHAIANIVGLSDGLDAKYEKASTGIPKTDLAADVQVSSLSGYATETYVNTQLASLVDSAPETLNTLDELANALGDDPNFATTIANQIGTKVTAVEGKGLSTNDLTDSLKTNYDAAYAHISASNNPHGVSLSQLGVNATATELNYVDGVTSNIQTQLNGKAASSHNHSASNITSGTLSVARGGTGSTTYKKDVTLTVGTNANSSSSLFGYTCQYIPYLHMCFVRMYVQPKSAWSADTPYQVGKISSSTYYPPSMMALSVYCQKEVNAYINTDGEICVWPYESIGTNYGIRIAGFWFV